jgi:uncharacterized protein YbbC (DUF1343 family)
MGRPSVIFGVDKLLILNPKWKNKRIGLLTNDGAYTSWGLKSRVALLQGGFNIVRLFSPEHGINATGADGAWIPHQRDELTNLPVVSLYQKEQLVNDQYIEDLDVLLVDLPDVGARFYTYVWSLTYFLEVSAQKKKTIILLDRPNPLGGDISKSEGPTLDQRCSSFIGRFNMPITHYCTLGELASYFNSTQRWGADLNIMTCGWERNQTFRDWKMPWINPSPALVNFESVQLYPGLCLLEATNFSVGRNSAYSFQWIGNPSVSLTDFNIDFQGLSYKNLSLRANNKNITGVLLCPTESFCSPVNLGFLVLYSLFNLHSEYFSWEKYPTQANPSGEKHLDLLTGIPDSYNLFTYKPEKFRETISGLIKTDWEKIIQPHLLYY